tara:strand:- start:1056 stop:1388 length:333 start_codon:yes stop_codon:yes gene_type:complete
MTQLEIVHEELKKISNISEDNARILKNGIGDRVSKLEKGLADLIKIVTELRIAVEQIKPQPDQPAWKKFIWKWFGTFIILAMFIGLLWLAFNVLPEPAALRILDLVPKGN